MSFPRQSNAEAIFSPQYVDRQKPEWVAADGPAEFRAIVEGVRASMPNLMVTVQGVVISDAGHVAGRLLWQCDVVERETIEMLRVDEGKVVEHWGAESWRRPQ